MKTLRKGSKMKNLTMIRGLIGLTALASFMTACGGDGNNSLLNPSLNFSQAIGDIEIITPNIGDQGVCLRPKIKIDVPSGATCDSANFGRIRDGVFLYREGSDRAGARILLSSPRITEIENNRCELELMPELTLLDNTSFVLETSFDDISGQAFSPTESITFKTRGLGESQANCIDDHFNVAADNGSGAARGWQPITSIVYTGLRDDNGDYILPDGDDLLGVLLGSANSILNTLLGLSPIPNPMTIRFDRKPDAASLQESLILKRYEGINLVPGSLANSTGVTIPLDIQESDITPISGQFGAWRAAIHLPYNYAYQSDHTYIFILLNTLQSTDGRFLKNVYMNSVVRE